jgi:hypothetical protein
VLLLLLLDAPEAMTLNHLSLLHFDSLNLLPLLSIHTWECHTPPTTCCRNLLPQVCSRLAEFSQNHHKSARFFIKR